MALTDEDCVEFHAQLSETRMDVKWIKERLEKGDIAIIKIEAKQVEMEKEQSFLKGKLTIMILVFTFFLSLVVNAILWLFTRFKIK
jgi:hypothetical protein